MHNGKNDGERKTGKHPEKHPEKHQGKQDGKRRRRNSRTVEARETLRLEILEAAMVEFGLMGFEQAKIDAIAQRAGVGKGTIYRYCPSKTQLIQDVLDLIDSRYRATLEKALAEITSRQQGDVVGKEYLRFLIDLVVLNARTYPEMLLVVTAIVSEAGSFGAIRRTALERLTTTGQTFAAFFRSQQEAGRVRPDLDPEAMGVILQSVFYAYIRLPPLLGYAEKLASGEWNSLLTDMLWHGVEAKGQTQEST